MNVKIEELENRTRAMDLPVAPNWLVNLMGILAALVLSLLAFNVSW